MLGSLRERQQSTLIPCHVDLAAVVTLAKGGGQVGCFYISFPPPLPGPGPM